MADDDDDDDRNDILIKTDRMESFSGRNKLTPTLIVVLPKKKLFTRQTLHLNVINSVTRKQSPNFYKSCLKWFH